MSWCARSSRLMRAPRRSPLRGRGPAWRDERARRFRREFASLAQVSPCAHAGAPSDRRGVDRMRDRVAPWRGVDAPTNVLSFPAVEPARLGEARLLGDVLIAFETVSREAEQESKALRDHYRHLVEDGQAEAMEALETRVLARLGVADPYDSIRLAGAA